MARKGKGGFSPVGHGDSEKEGKRVGQGNFANMPQEVSMKGYPKSPKYRGSEIDDTMSEIDGCNSRSEGMARRHVSDQH
jgi:hypothetical protein